MHDTKCPYGGQASLNNSDSNIFVKCLVLCSVICSSFCVSFIAFKPQTQGDFYLVESFRACL